VFGNEANVVDEIGEDGRDDSPIAVLDPDRYRRPLRGTAAGALQPAPTLIAEPGPSPRCCATRATTHSVDVLPFPPSNLSPGPESNAGSFDPVNVRGPEPPHDVALRRSAGEPWGQAVQLIESTGC
jgi:hypothetical protein